MELRGAVVIFIVIRLLKRVLREPTKRRLVLTLVAFTVSTLVSGTLFYLVEGVYGPQKDLTWSRSIYWAIVTMATVGYGDIVPKTFWGRVVACVTIVVGIAMFSLFISTLADVFMQGSLKRVLGLGRVKNVDVVVVGANEVCREAINELRRNMPKIRVAWVMEKKPRTPPEDVDFVVGDPTDDDTLKRAGIEKAKDLIVCVLDDSTAIHIVLTAKKLNKGLRIAALAKSSRAAELLKEAGVSIVVPFKRLGRELASAVFEPSVVHFLEEVTTARGRADLVEIVIDPSHAGKDVKDIIRELQVADRNARYLAVMLAKNSGEQVFAPKDDTKLDLGDKLVLVKVKEGVEPQKAASVSQQQQ
ncbi:MAG: hypothetical protein GXO32_08185 [Crenarchaeota archaeon]|nr:hypothetical protein [Thermoproteota archaeon]